MYKFAPAQAGEGKNEMTEIIMYLQQNWVPWLFALIGAALGYIIKKMRNQQRESRAIARGVQSLLRENLVHNYNKYQEREYCPIYAKESIKRVYTAYHELGGNDVATKLYQTLLEMPEEPKEE